MTFRYFVTALGHKKLSELETEEREILIILEGISHDFTEDISLLLKG